MHRATAYIGCIAWFVLLGGGIAAAQDAAGPPTVKVIADETKIIRGKEVLAVVKKGAVLHEIPQADEWIAVEIEKDGQIIRGWVRAADVARDPAAPPRPAEAKPLPSAPPGETDIITEPLDPKDPIRESSRGDIRNGAFPRNLIDPDIKKSYLDPRQVTELDRFGRDLYYGEEADRVAYVKKLIEITGRPRAEKIGVIFYDHTGRPSHLWPPSAAYLEKRRTAPEAPPASRVNSVAQRARLIESVCRNHAAWVEHRFSTSDGSVRLSNRQTEQMMAVAAARGSWPTKLKLMASITPLDVRIYCDADGQVAIQKIINVFGPPDSQTAGSICNIPRFVANSKAGADAKEIQGRWYRYGSVRLGVTEEGNILALQVVGPDWRNEDKIWGEKDAK